MESSPSTQDTAGLLAEGAEDWHLRLSFPGVHVTPAHASLVKVLQRAQPVMDRRRMKAPRGLWGQQLRAPRGHPLGKLGCEGSRESGQDPKGCRVQGGCLFSKMEEKALESVCMFLGVMQEERERETDALGVRGPKRPRSRGPKEHLPRSCSSWREEDVLASEGFYFLPEVSGVIS